MPMLTRHFVSRIATVMAVCALSFAATVANAQMTQEEFTTMLRQAVKDNPAIVMDVLRAESELVLEIAQQGNILRKQKALRANWEEDAKTPKKIDLQGRAFRGAKNAPITIAAYTDFTCPFCRQMEGILKDLLKTYKGKIRVTAKMLPKEKNAFALAAAQYSIAAFIQNEEKGWEFFDAMFEGMGLFQRDPDVFLADLTKRLGYDLKKLKSTAESPDVQSRLETDREEADRFGMEGTPCFLVNDLVIHGGLSKEMFSTAIDMALNLKKK